MDHHCTECHSYHDSSIGDDYSTIDQQVFLLMNRGMTEEDVDSHYSSKIDEREAPIKAMAFLILFLVCVATLLFLFIGL